MWASVLALSVLFLLLLLDTEACNARPFSDPMAAGTPCEYSAMVVAAGALDMEHESVCGGCHKQWWMGRKNI